VSARKLPTASLHVAAAERTGGMRPCCLSARCACACSRVDTIGPPAGCQNSIMSTLQLSSCERTVGRLDNMAHSQPPTINAWHMRTECCRTPNWEFAPVGNPE
jgi:hypothetical protein